MRSIIVDGSNISLHGVRKGKLAKLDSLAHVINALLASGMVPYTIFDASFKWLHTQEDSPARNEFENLLRNVPEHFQMSPKGEKADLFLLELALSLGAPVLTNDTLPEYGKMRDGFLPYKNGKVQVCNYQVFAGSVLIPDLDIRRRIEVGDASLVDVESRIGRVLACALEPGLTPAVPDAPAVRQKRSKPIKPEPAAQASTDLAVNDPPQASSGNQQSVQLAPIARIIKKFTGDGRQSVSELAGRLREHRDRYLKDQGIGKKSPSRWFGFGSLDEFIRNRLPEFKVKGGRIDKPD